MSAAPAEDTAVIFPSMKYSLFSPDASVKSSPAGARRKERSLGRASNCFSVSVMAQLDETETLPNTSDAAVVILHPAERFVPRRVDCFLEPSSVRPELHESNNSGLTEAGYRRQSVSTGDLRQPAPEQAGEHRHL